MPTYGTHITRTTSGSDPLVPEPLATSIIQEAPKSSAALSLMRRVPLSAKTQRMPVLDVLPVAYWVGGDVGMKQTANQAWKNVVMVVEELACIVPIPEAYMDDAERNIHVVLDDDVADVRRQRRQDLDQFEPLGRR